MVRLLNEGTSCFIVLLLLANSSIAFSHTISTFSQLENDNKNAELLYLDPYLNGERKKGIVAVVKNQEQIWLGQSELQNLRIKITLTPDMVKDFFNEKYILIPKEFDPHIDFSNLSIHLTIPPENLPLSWVKNEIIMPTQSPSVPAFYWNYLLLFLHEPFQNKANFYSAHKAVFTSNLGNLTNTFLARLGQDNSMIRLNNFYTVDFFKKNISLTIGDSFIDAPSWSSPIPMLGIKVEKNYKYVPDFLSYPTIDFKGALMTDGQVEIHLHNAKYFKRNLPMGRFFLDNPSLPMGSHFGDLIINDIKGQSRIIPFSYYIDSSILRPGLSTYSYSLGLVRKNYGIASFDYESPLFSLRHKWGITKFWTPELHFQFQLETNGLLLGSDQRFRLFNFGSAGFTSAISISDGDIHPLLGFDILINKFDINFRSFGLVAFPNFQPLGLFSPVDNKFRWSFNSNFRIDKNYIRNTSLNYIFIDNKFFRHNAIFLGQSFNISSRLQVNIRAHYDISSQNLGVFALLSIFLGGHSLNINAEANQNVIKTASQYNFSGTTNAGYRYRFTSGISHSASLHGFANLGMENQYFEGTLQLNATKKSFNYSTQMSGAFGCVANHCFLSKSIENGFALLQIPNRKDVVIAKEFGGIFGKTDSKGSLIITDLRPYEKVTMQALTRELDPKISTEELEKSITIWPGHNTAHLVKFSAPIIRRIMFRLVKNNNPLSAGGLISVIGLSMEGFIGGDGLVYLEIPENMSIIEGKSVSDLCSFNLKLPEPNDDIVENLGNIQCQ